MAIEESMEDGSCHIHIGTSNWELWSFIICEDWPYLIDCVYLSNYLT